MVKNVLLITIDSLCADHVPLEGDDKVETPRFSTIVSEGTSFNNAFATGPGTTCSFPALLTGTLPLSYGGLGPLSEDRPRVAAQMRGTGLNTGAFQTNPFLSNHFNYDVGFNQFKDYQNPLMGITTELFPRGIEVNNPKIQKLDKILNITGLLKKAYQIISGNPRPYVAAEIITDDVIKWLEGTDSSFFCWAHYMDVHHPCFPPQPTRERFGVAEVSAPEVSKWYSTVLKSPNQLDSKQRSQLVQLYKAAIVYVDSQLSRIIDYLKESTQWEETMIIITSDHGQLFGEYGQYGKPIRMYEELLRVPLVIVNGPRYLADLQDKLISLLDIPPLIHDVLDIDIPSTYDGRLPDQDFSREFVMAEHQVAEGLILGARRTNKLYEYNELEGKDGIYEVGPKKFTQTTNEDDTTRQLRHAVTERLDEIEVTVDRSDFDSDVKDRLTDLGYL